MLIFFKKKCQKNMFLSNFLSKSDQKYLNFAVGDREIRLCLGKSFNLDLCRIESELRRKFKKIQKKRRNPLGWAKKIGKRFLYFKKWYYLCSRKSKRPRGSTE